MSSEETQEYAITEYWQNAYEKSLALYPEKTVCNEIDVVEQTLEESCGAALIATAINKKTGRSLTDRDLVPLINAELAKRDSNIEREGTPVEAMRAIFSNFSIDYVERLSDRSHEDPEAVHAAKEALESKLREGYVCITPMQSYPEVMYLNIMTGKRLPKNYLTAEDEKQIGTVFHKVYINGKLDTSEDEPYWNGHYTMIIGMMVGPDGKEYYICADTSAKYGQRTAAHNRDQIDPEKYGIMLREKDLFLRNWHDTSIDGTIEYNHYYIGIKINDISSQPE